MFFGQLPSRKVILKAGVMYIRIYPPRFCSALFRAFSSTELWHVRRELRRKNEVDPQQSDRELFQLQPLGDIWVDADLAAVYWYARANKHLTIPESWQHAIDDFEKQLHAKASCLHFDLQPCLPALILLKLYFVAQVNPCECLRKQYNDLVLCSSSNVR